MPITRLSWATDEVGFSSQSLGRDLHVLRGRSTPSLLSRLRVIAPTATGIEDTSASLYLQQHNDVTFAFRPLFKGAPSANGMLYEGLGLHVDTTTGVVSVDATPPLPTRHNFIIEVQAQNVGQSTAFGR